MAKFQKIFLTICGAFLCFTASFAQQVHQDVYNLYAGSQLVYYTSSSVLSNNSHSSLTYMNFCANGTYWVSYDGSFTVNGDYGDKVYGASNGQDRGTWAIIDREGLPYIHLVDGNGNSNYYQVYKQNLLQGKWRVGRTKYILQRNKVTCN